MSDYVCLDQKVTAQVFNEKREKVSLKSVTIGQLLDAVCGDYQAADVVEVVRCRDCRYYDESDHLCILYGDKHWGMFFCADGGRRDDSDT